jgi:predicted DNA-binding transcriptional regulator YafY
MKVASRPPLRRIVVLDRLIRAGRYPNAKTVARELEVHQRTVYRDLEFLRDSLGAPLEFCHRHNGFYYRDADYALPLVRLTEAELVALFLAERLMQLYQGTPYERDLQRAFAKITATLPDTVSINLAALGESLSITPTAVTPQDVDKFRVLAAGVHHHRRLQLEYWTASRNQTTHRGVDPYHLTLIDGNWYLIGYCHLRQDVLMFATARVRSVKETDETFVRPSGFRVDTYLEGSFRALRGSGHHRVVLHFSSEIAGRVAEKVWHSSQSTEPMADGRLVVRFEVSDLREVQRWVLAWGSECQVLEPAELRAMTVAALRATLQQYRSGKGKGRKGR